MILRMLFLVIALAMLPIYGEEPVKEVKTGGIKLITLDNGNTVWTKKVGKGGIPVLTLHGGPGFSHEYFECMEDFLPEAGYQIIYYDQLGSYYSEQPGDFSLWTIERFCDEVEQVRAALGLEQFYLYGHSCGGLLAIEYALKYPEHIKGLIVSNMTASISCYTAYFNQLRQDLPAEIQALLYMHEDLGNFDAPEYQRVMFNRMYTMHICRYLPWPDPVLRTFKHINRQICDFMLGPNEFIVTGNLKEWDRWADLHEIKVPTLLMGARYDTVNPEEIRRMGQMMPSARVSICEEGSHFAMYDDQENYFHYLLQFLNDVEQATNDSCSALR